MKNVAAILKRDFLRLVKAPSALVIVMALLLLPSFYTWFNVAGFWNPYDNTGELCVCVVDEDRGAWSELTGPLDMGEQIVGELSSNDQLGWVFTDRASAMEQVRSGQAYAAFIIPGDFSEDTLTVFGKSFEEPELEYYVNEKAGGVSMKVTDTGATTLDETINSTFVSSVSETVAGVLNEALEEAGYDLEAAQEGAVGQLAAMDASLDDARSTVADLNETAQSVSEKAAQAQQSLASSEDELDDLSSELEDAAELLDSTQGALSPFVVSLMAGLDTSSALASQAASQTNGVIGSVSGSVSAAQSTVESLADQGRAMAGLNESIIESAGNLAASLPEGSGKDALEQSVSALKAQNDSLTTAIDGIESSYGAVSAASGDIASASDSLNFALQGSLAAADGYRGVLNSSTFPALNDAVSQLSAATYGLSEAVSNQKIVVDQAVSVLGQLTSALSQTASALGDTDGLLEGIQSDISSLRTDVAALGTANLLEQAIGEDSVDAGRIAGFMLSPTQIETVSLYSVNAYGSAMAPLFMNLTLWIGVFMLLVILRQEVDDEGLPGLSARQRYMGKFLFLAVLASLQALICCTGNLVLGVEVASVGLFYITALVASLTYLSIQYALSVLFQHVGKGLCVVLIFVQIPGATGLYPIEMTPSFFQAVYPFFPFTYGINALRESIAGFYGAQWITCIGILALFFAAFLAIGLLLRPLFVNLNRMFAQQIKESDIFNGEEAQIAPRRYRWEKLFGMLADKREFRADVIGAIEAFSSRYAFFRRWGIVAALALMCASGAVLALVGAGKVAILTVWLAELVILLLFTLVVEHIRDRLEHEQALTLLSESELKELFEDQGKRRAAYGRGLRGGDRR